METIYIQHFLRQLDHATTQGSALERGVVTTATEQYLFSLQDHIKEDLILFITYLTVDSSAPFGFRGIMKNDVLIDSGSSNPKCVSLITRPYKGQGDVLASLCIKASAPVLADIFGSKDTEIQLALAAPIPAVFMQPTQVVVPPTETFTTVVTHKTADVTNETPRSDVKKEVPPSAPTQAPVQEPVKIEFTDDDLDRLTAPSAPDPSLTAVVGDQSSSKLGKEVLTPKKKQHVYTKPN